MAQAYETSVRRRATGWAVAAIVTCQLMLMVDGVIVTVALPSIRTDLGLGTVGLSWVVSAYALSFAGLLLVSGRLGTLFGPRRMLLTGVAVFVVASAIGGLAPIGELLIAARAVQGVGAALAGPAIMVLLIANTEEGRERLRAMAWFIIASSAGSSIGLIAGGVLTVTLGWRWVMLVNVPIGVLVVVATRVFVRETGRHRGTLDVPGAVTSALAMVALVYGLSRAAQSSWGDPQVLIALVVAVMALVAIPAVESGSAYPVVQPRLLRGSKGATPYAGMLLLPAMMIGFFTFSVLYLQDVRGYDALRTGLVYLPWGASVIIGAKVVPGLIERIGERGTVALGVLVGVVGALAFAVLAAGAPLWLGVLLPCFVLGFAPRCTSHPRALASWLTPVPKTPAPPPACSSRSSSLVVRSASPPSPLSTPAVPMTALGRPWKRRWSRAPASASCFSCSWSSPRLPRPADFRRRSLTA
ncbi:MFS transporter [Phytohabitans suffuscus]|uniref:MFS transporter n=1 Tax=Phytohabitans suffuscus TaxID=624315 RepID=A0A6F8YB07_9ACTN|nr:MFS transporter [Phytohabitans suffuscus]BCB83141.1 MFS transporter [Phytohabitans suffuscus]